MNRSKTRIIRFLFSVIAQVFIAFLVGIIWGRSSKPTWICVRRGMLVGYCVVVLHSILVTYLGSVL